MSETKFYRGFLREGYTDGIMAGGWVWTGCDDDTRLLNAEPEDARFVSTIDELLGQLRAEFPDKDTQYGYVFETWNYYGSRVRQTTVPMFYPAAASSQWTLSDADVAVLHDLARKYKEVRVSGGTQYGDWLAESRVQPGFFVRGQHFVYNPKQAAKRAKKQQEALVTLYELDLSSERIIKELFPDNSPLQDVRYSIYDGDNSTTLQGGCRRLLGRWEIAVRFHGVVKTRKTNAIKQLVERWNANPTGNRAKYEALDGKTSDRGRRLADLVEGPMQGKKLPARPEPVPEPTVA